MQVTKIGFTPLKGTRHATHGTVELAREGPVGDRLFCLVDPGRERVLRTVENPTLVQARSHWADDVLTVRLDGTAHSGELVAKPTPTGRTMEVDYWGRRAVVEVVDGPWAAAFSRHLGYDVVLARSSRPGEVVYGASVTLVTTGSMSLLGQRVGHDVEDARFRATFLVDADEPHVEDRWPGRRLRVGDATLQVRAVVPRCAVVDVGPDTGIRDAPVLKSLAGYRRGEHEVHFGVDAEVVVPGAVRTGDSAELERG